MRSDEETVLGESRNVDDQVEWLDNDHVLYALSQGDATHSSASTNIWVLPTTGGAPTVMVQGGASPAVVHSPETRSRSVASVQANQSRSK